MTEEQKKLLKAELSRRLPYGLRGVVLVEMYNGHHDMIDGSAEYDTVELTVELVGIHTDGDIEVINVDEKHPNYDLSNDAFNVEDFIPFLRPMASRTAEEKEHLQSLQDIISDENYGDGFSPAAWHAIADWNTYCDEHRLDWTGLIGKRFANPAKDGMYDKKS